MGKNRYMDGFQCLSVIDNDLVSYLPVGIAVAIAKGDIVQITSGYLALSTVFNTNGYPFHYVALGQNTAAEAVASGTVSCQCIPIQNPYRWMVPVTANALLVQATNVGNMYTLDGSEDGLTIAAATTVNFGFHIEEIDVSARAIAVNAYGYAIGRFLWVAETT